MPTFTENSKLNFLIFRTVCFILNFQNLLELGLKNSLPKLLPVPWLWVGARNVSNARVNPELRLSGHNYFPCQTLKNSFVCCCFLTLYVSSVTSLSVWLQQLKHNVLPQVRVLDTENWKYGVLRYLQISFQQELLILQTVRTLGFSMFLPWKLANSSPPLQVLQDWKG